MREAQSELATKIVLHKYFGLGDVDKRVVRLFMGNKLLQGRAQPSLGES